MIGPRRRARSAWRIRGAVAPRAILAWIAIIIVISIGLHAVSPWLLPVRVYEGPMVQLATEEGVSLVWFTTRPAECQVVVEVGGQARTIPSVPDNNRHLVRVDGLQAATSYPYEIRVGERGLTKGLAFQTNRRADQPFSFLVFGDSGKASRAQYALAGDMGKVTPAPDFLLHTGDLVYNDGERRKYQDRFFTPYQSFLPRVAFWPSVGNHDITPDDVGVSVPSAVAGRLAYQQVFELPQNGPAGLPPDFNYYFDYGAARIVVLDTNADEDTMRERIGPWLRDVLSDDDRHWKFVVYHHATYTAGKYGNDLRPQRVLVPVFDALGVDVVFNGHDHNYQRTMPLRGGEVVPPGEGTVYVVTGAGGARLYEVLKENRPGYVAAAVDDEYSFTQVSVDGDELSLKQIATGGKVIDQVRWRKSASATSPTAELTTRGSASAPVDAPATSPTPTTATAP